ncbi:MAG: RusA family crossover junction endodeoxyribonuclease [Pseudomonadota bacterium]
MDPTITFEVPGRPTPKARPYMTAGGKVFTPEKTAAAERSVKWMLRAAMKGRDPLTCPVAVEIVAHFPAAKAKAKWLVGRPHDQTPDIDNVVKLILDGCNRLAWKDDGQVYQILASGWWSHSDEARTVVKIYAWDPVEQLKLLDLPKTKTLRTFA